LTRGDHNLRGLIRGCDKGGIEETQRGGIGRLEKETKGRVADGDDGAKRDHKKLCWAYPGGRGSDSSQKGRR